MHSRGAILRVDLTSGKISKGPIPPQMSRKYLGGEGINTRLLWEHFLRVDPKSDPLGPDNVLIAGLGPLGGTAFGCGSKMKWTFKSPYNIFGDSVSGGFFGSHMRWAGYDHVVITGKAKSPVYLWIDDDTVEIREAQHLWGKDSEETDQALKKELGDSEVQTACIGRAGENLVSYASIIVSGHRVAGRSGAGAVMGSKNLKAIAVRGSQGIPVYDPKGFFKAIDGFVEAQYKVPARPRDGWKAYGTLIITGHYQKMGVNAFRNDQHSVVPAEKYENLSHWWYRENMAATSFSCSPGCMWACAGGYKVKDKDNATVKAGAAAEGFKPEYVIIASLGIMNDIPDLVEVSHLGGLCRKHGMDATEIGACCGFLMELWQQGFINEKDLEEWTGEPLRLEWGNARAVEKVINSVALQNNKLGELLKRGVYRAAQRMEDLKNFPALNFALYGKAGATFIEEVRHTPSWALNMAVASRGADHLKGVGTLDKLPRPDLSMHYFGTPEAAEPLSTKLKGASSVVSENRNGLINSLGVCNFPMLYDAIAYPVELFAQAVSALTGEALTAEELSRAGERVVNLEKAFNSRLGYRREEDRLCPRWLDQEIADGPGKGWKAGDYLEQLKDEYYSYHGWDPKTSLQRREKLEELDMGDVIAVLEKEKALAP